MRELQVRGGEVHLVVGSLINNLPLLSALHNHIIVVVLRTHYSERAGLDRRKKRKERKKKNSTRFQHKKKKKKKKGKKKKRKKKRRTKEELFTEGCGD